VILDAINAALEGITGLLHPIEDDEDD
jgi:hypothetical protein